MVWARDAREIQEKIYVPEEATMRGTMRCTGLKMCAQTSKDALLCQDGTMHNRITDDIPCVDWKWTFPSLYSQRSSLPRTTNPDPDLETTVTPKHCASTPTSSRPAPR
ncbi:hypothetical protein ACJRO7_017509 [Eucalyptus globulus]|uniref:Uncharacterized protein n=1 Tax=Eucalyptus globulus TaxID=34317 RepID=A0ABD3KUN9_EUCGL